MTRRGKDGWRDRFYVLCDYNDGGCGASSGWYHYADEAVWAWNRRKTATLDEVHFAIVEAGQGSSKFKLGDTIRFSPSEIRHILEERVFKEDDE